MMAVVKLLVLAALLMLSGCAKMTEEERAQKAQELYTSGLSAYREGDYGSASWDLEEALKFMDYLSPEQLENAKFLLGKSYYMDEEYVNAIVALEDYIFYYPKLPRTEEAYYLLVDSYIRVSPDPYRDQEYTWKAIDKAKEFLSRFPNSPFAPKVQKLIEEAYRKIARHEFLIAKFYEDYGYTYSAAIRYREVLINFPGYISEEETAYRYIRSLLMVDRQVRREKEKIGDLIEEVEERLEDARDEEEKEAIRRRLEFLRKELERWDRIREESLREALSALRKFREVYGATLYYKELERLAREKGWKSSDS